MAIFATFLILTFELSADIGNLTKNRSKMSGLKLWLCSVCSSQADNYIDLIAFGHEIQLFKDKLGLLGIV